MERVAPGKRGDGVVPATNDHLLQLLDDRRDVIVSEWRRALIRGGFASLESASLHRVLDALARRVAALLLVEPFSEAEAQSIGVALARLPFAHPEALGCTVDILGRFLVGLPGDDMVSLQPKLVELLSRTVVGFLREHDELVREQQHDMHRALFDATRRAEDARRASEARYRAVVREATEGIVLVDARTTRIVETNRAFQTVMGYAAQELVGMPVQAITVDGQASIDEGVRETLRHGRRDVGERLCRRRDGTLVPLEVSATTVHTGGEVLLCIVTRDISERRQSEAELNAARGALAGSREDERSHLARELHDGAVQTLVGLRYQLVAARHGVLGQKPSEPSEEIRQVEAGIAQVVSELRDLIGELRPAGLDEGGLTAALENYAGSLRSSADIHLEVSPEVEELPRSLAICLVRIVQEAVRNALRHGRAGQVSIRLRPRPAGIILRVADNGAGFIVPQPLSAMARANHFGVLGMSERVGQLQGRLRIRSRPGKGTIVTVRLPRSSETDGA